MSTKPTYDELAQLVKDLKGEVSQYKEIKERLHFLSLISEQVADSILTTDLDFKITWANKAFMQLFGYTMEEIKGKIPDFLNAESNSPEIQQDIYQTVSTGQVWRGETLNKKKDGSTFLCEIMVFPLVDERGKTFAYAGHQRDITIRKKAEYALKESEEHFRSLAESSQDYIMRYDKECKHIYINSAALNATGVTKEEMIGKSHREMGIFTKEQCDFLEEKVQHVFKTGESIGTQFEWESSDGIITLDWRLTPEFNEEGRVHTVLGVSRDISGIKRAEKERQRLEEQLQQAQKMEAIGTLAGGIAHDFNNILGSIMGYTELSIKGLPEDSIVKTNMQRVMISAERARDLVKQILAFSRKQKSERKPLYINLVIGEVLKMLRSTIPTTVEIRSDLGENLNLALVDPTQIQQLIMNLCTNAVYAMGEEGGVLEITSREVDFYHGTTLNKDIKSGRYHKITVKDNGHGMSQDVQSRIFEPYFTTKDGEGTGMGLAVVHGIVKNHDGEISVSSEPGKGTTFEIYLPVLKEGDLVTPSIDMEEIIKGGSERILLVDDEKNLVDMGKQMLETLGYTVTVRTSSIEALELFKNDPNRFDLIITDQTMPNMTGIHLASGITHIKPNIPIILCTGFSELINEENFRSKGVSAFIMKPIILAEIAALIRKVLDEPS
jgi:PAS domain S-box-containing protein